MIKKSHIRKHAGEIFLVLSAASYCLEWYLIRKLMGLGLSPFDVVFARSLFTPVIIAAIFPFFIRDFFSFTGYRKRDYKYVFLLSCSAMTCSIFFNFALKVTTVANTLVLFYLCIFWGIIFGYLFLNEKSTYRSIFFTFIAFAGIGIALLKSGGRFSLSFGIGEASALLGGIIFSLDAIFSRKIRHTNTFQRLFIVNSIATALYLFITLITQDISYFTKFFTGEFLFYALALALTCGVIAKGFMYLGYNRTPVSIALVILLLEPISQMVSAYFIADEKISFMNSIGIFIVFMMAILISREKR